MMYIFSINEERTHSADTTVVFPKWKAVSSYPQFPDTLLIPTLREHSLAHVYPTKLYPHCAQL